jgi:DNA-nicking Smr family endonuclease
MRPPRGLSPEEAALWARVTGTVTPIDLHRQGELAIRRADAASTPPRALSPARAQAQPPSADRVSPADAARSRQVPRFAEVRHPDRSGLDGSWERKLAKAQLAPDFTLDLHGHTLDAAHRRLDQGLALALARHARVVLVITGRPRPVDAADRGSRRGAIRAKLVDWLAVGPHAAKIAAIRPAHQRHGGMGAVYVVLKRAR